MSESFRVPDPEMKGFSLIRIDGVPQFDDPENTPEEVKASLTTEDLRAMPADIVARLGLSRKLEA